MHNSGSTPPGGPADGGDAVRTGSGFSPREETPSQPAALQAHGRPGAQPRSVTPASTPGRRGRRMESGVRRGSQAGPYLLAVHPAVTRQPEMERWDRTGRLLFSGSSTNLKVISVAGLQVNAGSRMPPAARAGPQGTLRLPAELARCAGVGDRAGTEASSAGTESLGDFRNLLCK